MRLRRSHSRGGISSATQEGPDPSGCARRDEPRASPGAMRRQDGCRGGRTDGRTVINHQAGTDKRTLPAVLKDAKLQSPAGFNPPGPAGLSVLREEFWSVPRPRAQPQPPGAAGASREHPHLGAPSLRSPWVMSPVTDQRGSFTEQGLWVPRLLREGAVTN